MSTYGSDAISPLAASRINPDELQRAAVASYQRGLGACGEETATWPPARQRE